MRKLCKQLKFTRFRPIWVFVHSGDLPSEALDHIVDSGAEYHGQGWIKCKSKPQLFAVALTIKHHDLVYTIRLNDSSFKPPEFKLTDTSKMVLLSHIAKVTGG